MWIQVPFFAGWTATLPATFCAFSFFSGSSRDLDQFLLWSRLQALLRLSGRRRSLRFLFPFAICRLCAAHPAPLTRTLRLWGRLPAQPVRVRGPSDLIVHLFFRQPITKEGRMVLLVCSFFQVAPHRVCPKGSTCRPPVAILWSKRCGGLTFPPFFAAWIPDAALCYFLLPPGHGRRHPPTHCRASPVRSQVDDKEQRLSFSGQLRRRPCPPPWTLRSVKIPMETIFFFPFPKPHTPRLVFLLDTGIGATLAPCASPFFGIVVGRCAPFSSPRAQRALRLSPIGTIPSPRLPSSHPRIANATGHARRTVAETPDFILRDCLCDLARVRGPFPSLISVPKRPPLFLFQRYARG